MERRQHNMNRCRIPVETTLLVSDADNVTAFNIPGGIHESLLMHQVICSTFRPERCSRALYLGEPNNEVSAKTVTVPVVQLFLSVCAGVFVVV